ncbi:hypothetical protein QFC22_006652 [Naganishia vaughanmartiniae]|uniref:Uncharacterized protein n=1 Tax=Naganishia vaughanmartiniae TaxID=1424756 RepID=A0ACC2WH96_9TREE|nr:hypothetical protein QFC22_006652 [Naganishia vaughanmartiniae]
MEGIQQDDSHGGGAANGAAGNRNVAVTYRLEKYAVEFLGDDEDANSPALSCTVDECLAIEMLEHAQSLGIRKFVLLDERAEEERLFLWLFNPDTDISWGTIHLDMRTGALTSDGKSGKFVIVLWREITSEKPIPASERHEVLEYPASAIEQIRAVLGGDEAGVPRDGKMMGDWRVGYLRRG